MNRCFLDPLQQLRNVKVRRERALAIGDGIMTDIAGAGVAGIRSVFVGSGVHVEGRQHGMK